MSALDELLSGMDDQTDIPQPKKESALDKVLRDKSPGQGEAFLRGAGQGATFGLIDEMAGGGASSKASIQALEQERLRAMVEASQAGDWDTYRKLQRGILEEGAAAGEARKQEYRARDTQAREAYPKTFMGGEFAGALPLAATGYGTLAKTASMPMKMLVGGTIGAGEGAFYGFNQGEGLEDRLRNARTGALIGGGGGTLAAPLSAGFGAAWRGVRNAGKKYVPEEVDYIVRALRRDKMGLDEAADAMRAGSDMGAMPIDLGPNMQQSGKAVASLPGRGQTVIRDAVDARKDLAKPRLEGVVDDVFGPVQNQYIEGTKEAAERAARAKSGYLPAFRAGWKDGVPPNELMDIMRRLDPEDLAEAKGIARRLGREFGGGDIVSFAEDGAVKIERYPTLEEAEYIYRAVRDKAGAQFSGGKGSAGAATASVKNDLKRILDTSSDALKNARQQYADDSAILEAREAGRSIFNNKKGDFDKLQVTYPGMKGDPKKAFKSGTRSAIADKMDTASWNAQDSAKSLRTDRNFDKMALVLEDEEAANKIMDALETQRVQQISNNAVTSGSDTAAKQAAMGELSSNPNLQEPGFWHSIGNIGRFGDAGHAIKRALVENRLARKGETMRAGVAELLTDPDKLIEAARYGPRIEKLNASEENAQRLARALLRAGQRPAVSYKTGGEF